MASGSNERQIILRPSWKQFFWRYLFAVLAIPVFGLGLVGLYLLRKKQKETRYLVSDTGISAIDSRYRQNIDLANIQQITLEQSRFQERLGIGTLRIHTSGSEMILAGITGPSELKEMIEDAVAYIKERERKKNIRPQPEPKYKPGSIDKMDYLTGLWQQGLLSDEDYKEEKKNFE